MDNFWRPCKNWCLIVSVKQTKLNIISCQGIDSLGWNEFKHIQSLVLSFHLFAFTLSFLHLISALESNVVLWSNYLLHINSLMECNDKLPCLVYFVYHKRLTWRTQYCFEEKKRVLNMLECMNTCFKLFNIIYIILTLNTFT